MKKIVLVAFLGLFVIAVSSAFAGTTNTATVNPIVQTDDDPTPTTTSNQETEEHQPQCEKKCEKTCEKKCCHKENSKCTHNEEAKEE